MSQIFSPKTVKQAEIDRKQGLKSRNRCNNYESSDDNESESSDNSNTNNSEKEKENNYIINNNKTNTTNSKINDKDNHESVFSTSVVEPTSISASFLNNNDRSGLSKPTSATQTTPSVSTASSELAGNKALAEIMTRSQWKINTSFEGGRIDFSRICSICLTDDPTKTLITPCLCTGKRSHQHKKCIEGWIEQTGAASCPFCLVRYEYSKRGKNFWSYVRDCGLEQEFLVELAALAFSLYLFLVGLSVCYQYLFVINNVSSSSSCGEQQSSLSSPHATTNWTSWIGAALFCIATILLLIGIISMSLNTAFRHYVRYWLYSRTHFMVDVKPYKLTGATSEPIADGSADGGGGKSSTIQTVAAAAPLQAGALAGHGQSNN